MFHIDIRSKKLKKLIFLSILLIVIFTISACNTIPGTATVTVEPGAQANITGSPEVTASPIETYFTCAGRQGCNPEDALTGLLSSIENAKISIDLAMYNLNLTEVADALVSASKQGVQVRLVTDSSDIDGEAMQRLHDANIPIVERANGDGLMHDKFVVIDGKEVWTGSLNLTWSGLNEDNNNLVRIDSEKVAADYEAEFEEMFKDRRFGADSSSNTPYPKIIISGIPVEVYFAPEDHVESRLLGLIQDAKTSVDFLALTFTLNSMSDALIADANRGVQVRGVYEEGNALTDTGSDYYTMRQAGLDVLLDGNAGLMHHKVMIIDHEIVVFGSYNFTSSAERRNDENLIIAVDADLAKQFEAEFERIYSIAKP
jgi:phosphatidylserine/phosphatidylglycerophosphate/cardiolipin synthase-like enzyme